jgi:adenosine deaminase
MANAEPSAALLALCRRLPKVELHAHLNGSLRESTLLELAGVSGIDPAVRELVRKGAGLVAGNASARCMPN